MKHFKISQFTSKFIGFFNFHQFTFCVDIENTKKVLYSFRRRVLYLQFSMLTNVRFYLTFTSWSVRYRKYRMTWHHCRGVKLLFMLFMHDLKKHSITFWLNYRYCCDKRIRIHSIKPSMQFSKFWYNMCAFERSILFRFIKF